MTIQRRWNPKQSWRPQVLYGPRNEDGHQYANATILPLQLRRQQSHPWIPLVRSSTTKNRLGPRMDSPRPITYRPPVSQRRQSPVSPPTSNSATRHSRATNKTTPSQIRQRPPPVSRLPRCLRTMKRKRPSPIKDLGPCHRIETRRPGNPHQQNHPPLPDRTRGALPIPQRTHRPRNHPTIKKPLRRILLLYQEEKRKAQTSPRLLSSKRLDGQEPLPPSPHTLPN